MTKSGLIQAVAERLKNVSSRDVEVLVNTLFEGMIDALKRGERIEIRGFGSFTVRKRRGRLGRNPKTGVAIDVPAKRVPFFTVGHDLRERVNRGAGSDETVQEQGGAAGELPVETDAALSQAGSAP